MKINNQSIGQGFPCYIIAEISANHNNDYKKAIQLIEAAKEAGADAVKMQTYTPDTMTIECYNDYFKIKSGPWKGRTLYDLYREASMPWEWQITLKKAADEIGICLFSTPFDVSSVDFLVKMDVPAFKIASFEIVDIPLLQYIASQNRPIILSTGMCTLSEIESAVNSICKAGNSEIALLKCISDYPANPDEMNLANIQVLKNTFDVISGLSDHSLCNEIAIAAVSLGASILEKHLTLRRSDGGPDSGFSLEPDEFRAMVSSIRTVEKAIGKPNFSPTNGEMKNIGFRRSLFVVNDIRAGECFTMKNIRSIRPGYGLAPIHFENILGRKCRVDIKKGTPLSWGHIYNE
jgi:pseudaminic acid synthase